MSYKEFQQVVRRLYIAFPAVQEWVKRNSPDMAGTHKAWFRSVEQCTVAECNAVIDAWLDGKKAPPTYQEQTQMGLTIRACVMFDRAKNRKLELSEEQRAIQAETEGRAKRKQRGNYVSLLAQFSRCVEIRGKVVDGLLDGEEADRLIAAELAKIKVDAPYEGPRYECSTCNDRGLVYVFHPVDIQRVKSGEKIVCGECVTRCPCGAGDQYRTAKLQDYASHRYCRVDQDLDQWLAPKPVVNYGSYQSNGVFDREYQ